MPIMRKMPVFFFILMASSAHAWDGYDYEKGSYVEIEKGNLVRSGEEIEYYDWGSGEYRTGEVQSINRFGSSVEVEVEDSETGEVRTFEMDD
jgi:predicted transcriptional regulator